jgi:hypothetical protein
MAMASEAGIEIDVAIAMESQLVVETKGRKGKNFGHVAQSCTFRRIPRKGTDRRILHFGKGWKNITTSSGLQAVIFIVIGLWSHVWSTLCTLYFC